MGTTVLDRFYIERRLGAGGFGTVYQAWDGRLERDVAVKVIDAGGEAGRRVLVEAQAAARLNHTGIVTLYELGEADGQALLVSELIDGDTLHRLTLDGVLSDREIGDIGADLCEALDHAHSRGVIHRDVKPQNVLVTDRDSQAKLMDFGIARVLDSAGLTATGSVVGTLAYMAPEQAEGRQAGKEADVYSLALTLYECWSGHNPHVRESPAATARVIGKRLPSLGRRRRDLPPALVAIVDACLEPEPRRRPGLEHLGNVIEASLDDLDAGSTPPSRGRSLPELDLSPATCLAAGSTALLCGLILAAVVAVGSAGPVWGYLLIPGAALLLLFSPRLAFLGSVLGLSAWLAAASRPGAALVLALLAIPPALAVATSRAALLPAAAPALGALGFAPLYPALVAFVPRWRTRALLAATGFAWLAVGEVVLRRDLWLGAGVHPPRGWEGSVGQALGDVLVPLASDPRFIAGLFAWVVAAIVAGVILAPIRVWRARRPAPPRGYERLREVPATEPAMRQVGPPGAMAANRGHSALVS